MMNKRWWKRDEIDDRWNCLNIYFYFKSSSVYIRGLSMYESWFTDIYYLISYSSSSLIHQHLHLHHLSIASPFTLRLSPFASLYALRPFASLIALHAWLYALRPSRFALRFTLYALHALRPSRFALRLYAWIMKTIY